jgi:hypothetical protein
MRLIRDMMPEYT